jgi:hypothetical protein
VAREAVVQQLGVDRCEGVDCLPVPGWRAEVRHIADGGGPVSHGVIESLIETKIRLFVADFCIMRWLQSCCRLVDRQDLYVRGWADRHKGRVLVANRTREM